MPNDIPSQTARPLRSASLRMIAPVVLTAGGLAAAFGAASCCAIPLLLGGVGLGGLASAIFMPALGPFQSYLIVAALVCLAAGGLLLWRHDACSRRGPRTALTVTVIGWILGAALLVLGYAYG